jgi:C4-dicarboxylate-specific signal transduction histidine kinase
MSRSLTRGGSSPALGPFLNRLLHDLCQPLNLARVVAQDVALDARRARLEVATVPERMADIIGAMDRLRDELGRIGDFAQRRMERPGRAPADLADACQRAIAAARQSCPSIDVTFERGPELQLAGPTLTAAQDILGELLDNAVRAAHETGRREPLVHLAASERDRCLVLSVRDNGGGIAPEARTSLFEPFFTAWPGSSGLGLAQAVAQARACGGSIALVSSDETGATFEIVLPLAVGDATGSETAGG